jgi:transposase
MSVTEIADELGCTHHTVCYWLARHGIQTRTREEVTHNQFDNTVSNEKPFENEQLLEQLHINEGLSVSEIAEELGCSRGPVRTNIERYGLEKEVTGFKLEQLNYEVPEECPWRDEKLMRLLYREHELSTVDIKELLDCSGATISTWMDKHGIELRGTHERPSKVELRRLYIDKGKSGIQIAKRLGVSPDTVYRWLREHGIEIRDVSDYKHPSLEDGEELRRMYQEEGMTISAIADELGAHGMTVRSVFDEHGIEVRPQHVEISGEKNPFWKGGQEPYGEGWTDEKRQMVLERDEYLCQSCGISQEEHKESTGQGLHIHHVQPANQVDDPVKRNAESNLVSLCSSCHSKWEGIPLRPHLDSSSG